MKRSIPIRLNRPRKSKYGVRTDALGKAKRTVDGILFASQREAKRFSELKPLRDSGAIGHFAMQQRFELKVGAVVIGKYVSDFVYLQDGHWIIEDAKGFKTPLYRWKKKHFEAQYGIKITEV